MYLSLPLPDKRTRSFEVTVVRVDGSKAPTCYSVAVPIAGKLFTSHDHMLYCCACMHLINATQGHAVKAVTHHWTIQHSCYHP